MANGMLPPVCHPPGPSHAARARPAARSRWPLALIGLTALLALAAIVLEVAILKGNRRPAETAAAETPAPLPPPPAVEERPRPAPPVVAPAPPPSRPQPAPAAGKPPVVETPPVPAPAAMKLANVPPPQEALPAPPRGASVPPPDASERPPPPQEMLLEALGGLTAAHLYQTYLNIGLLADGVEGEIYSRADARKLLATVAGLCENVDRQLARLPEENLKPDERQALLQVRTVSALLRTQSQEVQAFWESGDKEHAKRFHKAREESWAALKKLMDLKD